MIILQSEKLLCIVDGYVMININLAEISEEGGLALMKGAEVYKGLQEGR